MEDLRAFVRVSERAASTWEIRAKKDYRHAYTNFLQSDRPLERACVFHRVLNNRWQNKAAGSRVRTSRGRASR